MSPRHAAAPLAVIQEGGDTTYDDAPNVRGHLATAPGIWLPPCSRRTIGLWIVRCPTCFGQHVHRGGPNGAIRAAGCGRGRYLVRPR